MPRVSLSDFDIAKAKESVRKLDAVISQEISRQAREVKAGDYEKLVETLSGKKAGDNMGNRKNPRCNNEGYADPTPYEALRNIDKANEALDDKVNFLFKVIRFIASEAGFEILNRIEVQDRHTGKIFK